MGYINFSPLLFLPSYIFCPFSCHLIHSPFMSPSLKAPSKCFCLFS